MVPFPPGPPVRKALGPQPVAATGGSQAVVAGIVAREQEGWRALKPSWPRARDNPADSGNQRIHGRGEMESVGHAWGEYSGGRISNLRPWVMTGLSIGNWEYETSGCTPLRQCRPNMARSNRPLSGLSQRSSMASTELCVTRSSINAFVASRKSVKSLTIPRADIRAHEFQALQFKIKARERWR